MSFDNCVLKNTLKMSQYFSKNLMKTRPACWVSRARPKDKYLFRTLPPSCPTRSFDNALALLFLSDTDEKRKRVLHKYVSLFAWGECRRGITAWVHRCRQTEAVYCSSRINAKCILLPFDVVICAPTPLEWQPSRAAQGRDLQAQHRYVADTLKLETRDNVEVAEGLKAPSAAAVGGRDLVATPVLEEATSTLFR